MGCHTLEISGDGALKMKRITFPLGVAFGLLFGIAIIEAAHAGVSGTPDPTAAQIYQAVESGNLPQAQQLIQQVLKDHPQSAQAHYVAAEVDAAARNYGLASQELIAADRLEPGLPFARPQAVAELQRQLGMTAIFSKLDKARVARAKEDIRAIETALTEYRLDNSAFPTTREGLKALVKQPSDSSVTHWHGPYITRLSHDPWGHPYHYVYPGTHGQVYDLYSLGSDNQSRGNGVDADVIGNWNLGD